MNNLIRIQRDFFTPIGILSMKDLPPLRYNIHRYESQFGRLPQLNQAKALYRQMALTAILYNDMETKSLADTFKTYVANEWNATLKLVSQVASHSVQERTKISAKVPFHTDSRLQ